MSSNHNSPTAVKHLEILPEIELPNGNQQANDVITSANSNCSTPSTKHKSPKCRQSVKDLKDSEAIDPLASSPLLLQENNRSNSNANDYVSADSEKDALIMSKTSSNF